MNSTPSTVDDAMPQSEVTRLGDLFSWQSILFVTLCVAGLAIGAAYIFGATWNDQPLLEGQYYWIFIGCFTAAAYIALPPFPGHMKVPVYDLAAAAIGMGISIYFSAHAWEMVQAGWTNIALGTVIALLMLELARRSGGIPFLL